MLPLAEAEAEAEVGAQAEAEFETDSRLAVRQQQGAYMGIDLVLRTYVSR